MEQRAEYQHLKADLAQQYLEGHLSGPSGNWRPREICGTGRATEEAGLLAPIETNAFLATAQREVLLQNLRLIKRHLVG